MTYVWHTVTDFLLKRPKTVIITWRNTDKKKDAPTETQSTPVDSAMTWKCPTARCTRSLKNLEKTSRNCRIFTIFTPNFQWNKDEKSFANYQLVTAILFFPTTFSPFETFQRVGIFYRIQIITLVAICSVHGKNVNWSFILTEYHVMKGCTESQ